MKDQNVLVQCALSTCLHFSPRDKDTSSGTGGHWARWPGRGRRGRETSVIIRIELMSACWTKSRAVETERKDAGGMTRR